MDLITKKLSGKNIVVTGGSRGIGAGIAIWLAREGARVAIIYSSNSSAAEKTLASLPGSGHLAIQMNISEEGSVQKGFDEIFEKFGGIHGLVNNAGITKDQLILRMKSEDFKNVLDTNLLGTFLCTRLCVKAMLKGKVPGSIVNITSIVGQTGNAGQANYAASKAGVEAFSKSIAQEMASRGIRVNCIAPGFIVTEMTDVLTDAQKSAILSKVPLGHFGSVDDIASATSFLLSEESKYITGQTIGVNGGMYM